jgi:A/G-specific adenine glycosylase
MPEQSETGEGRTLSGAAVPAVRRKIIRWGKEHYRAYPWREPARPWHGLVAEILLQRTKADTVVPVYRAFLRRFRTTSALANASLAEIQAIIYPLGLRWRAPLLKELGRELAARKDLPPANLESLKSLPGVGPYAAAAWLGFHGGQRAVIVDANVVRLLCRLVGTAMDGETRRKKWLIELADRLTPQSDWKEYNYAVLDFTMQVCTRKPACRTCPLKEHCRYGMENADA